MVLLAGGASNSRAADETTIHAERAQGTIRIDGALDDVAWAEAAVIPDLIQQEPHPGAPAPFRTEVRILVDADDIYLGFTCIERPSPERAIMRLEFDAG